MYLKHLLIFSLVAQVVLSQQVPPLTGDINQPAEGGQRELPQSTSNEQNVPPLVAPDEIAQPPPATEPNASSKSLELSPGPPMTGTIAAGGEQIEANTISDAAHNSTLIEASPVSEGVKNNGNQVVELPSNQVVPAEVVATQQVIEDVTKTEVAKEPAQPEVLVPTAGSPAVNVTQFKDDTAMTNNSQIEANSIPDTHPAAIKTVDTGLNEEELNNPNLIYKFDYDSCGSVVPLPIMNMSINRILSTINGQNCSEQQGLKLLPMTNKLIRDRVMEVSSMPIELSQLFGAISTAIKCSNKPEEYEEDGKHKVRFMLKFELDLGDKKMRSRWRHYPRFENGGIPLGMFDSGNRNKGRAAQTTMTKCQRFRIDTGDYYLELLTFRTSIDIQVSLARIDETAYAISAHLGGQIHVSNFTVDELYLGHKLHISPIGSGRGNRMSSNKVAGHSPVSFSSLHNALAPTVQVFHDQNNHHRRNNWLLDMYGNWLRHEYKGQLAGLLGQPLVDGLNSCFVIQ